MLRVRGIMGRMRALVVTALPEPCRRPAPFLKNKVEGGETVKAGRTVIKSRVAATCTVCRVTDTYMYVNKKEEVGAFWGAVERDLSARLTL